MAVISFPAVDVHAHFLPRSYRDALDRAGIEHPDGFPFVPNWSVDSALARMDELGIAHALLSISSPGLSFVAAEQRTGLARAVNEDGAGAVRSHPHRLGFFASLPLPDVDAALMDRVCERGPACRWVHPDDQLRRYLSRRSAAGAGDARA
jgi:6-methylsalicylate decarboxylase